MVVVNPIPKGNADAEVHGVYDALAGKFGRMPNIFGVMAHRPAVLSSFMPFFQSVMGGTLEPRYKELAYLATSMLNGCEY